MENMTELTNYVCENAKMCLEEEDGTKLEKFPIAIVKFVIEEFSNHCVFATPPNERKLVSILEKKKETMTQACIEVYGKIGGDGELSHSENGISRVYESSWIPPKFFHGLPNEVKIISV